jgi:hydroxylamine reductase
MFCYQCEQTMKGTGCNLTAGVCGKEALTAESQDLLVTITKNVGVVANKLRKNGMKDREADLFVMDALFTTVTNVNFDSQKVIELAVKGLNIRDRLYKVAKEKGIEMPAFKNFPNKAEEVQKIWNEISIPKRRTDRGDDAAGIEELITYGLKGMAAYAHHAHILNVEDDGVFAFFHEALDFISTQRKADELLGMALKVGEVNLKVMELLDTANTKNYGHPEPTKVRITSIKGKAILVSGHDLKDLEEILKQTEGKGINVYTHGEMLPCNAYPQLKKYKHLVGNYGSAWQNQQKEFNEFPGSIIMTTNCIQKPKETYTARIFTCGLVRFPGVTHIENRNFTPAIQAALQEKGFEHDEPEKFITIGFGHNTVMSVADKVINGVKAGKIRHFFLIGGCDGAKPGRDYYTEFAQSVPNDCVILTLACGKYRFNKLEFGDIDGIPRLLDIGQCNDAYSAIQIAVALAGAFKTDVNSLPLSLILSWYEQKAVCILLTLLHLGIKNIHLGPSLPAFVTPSVLNILVEKFSIRPVSTPKEDLKRILG